MTTPPAAGGASSNISVDVEAAGPIPATYSLLSLGASVVNDPMQHFYAEFQPITENIVPEALAVSGFSLTALAQQGQAPEAAMRRFRDWITKYLVTGVRPSLWGSMRGSIGRSLIGTFILTWERILLVLTGCEFCNWS